MRTCLLHMHACLYACMYVRTDLYLRVYIYIYVVYTCICVDTHAHTYMSVVDLAEESWKTLLLLLLLLLCMGYSQHHGW